MLISSSFETARLTLSPIFPRGESSAFAQCKKLVERHPFLTGLSGPSIVRKLFGR